VVITHQTAKRLAAKLAVFFFVNSFEERALIPVRTLVTLQRFAKVGLGDVHHTDFQLLVSLGIAHHVVQATPCAFELLEIFVVKNLVDLV
jgi:hypothetical protein